MIIGVDLGNKSRNAIAVMDGSTLLDYSSLLYDPKIRTTLEHRQLICQQISEYISKYNLTKDDWLVFEDINMYMHGRKSRLANIVSLAYIHATFVNTFSDKINIAAVNVKTWKKYVLENCNASKEDSVKYVELHYPQVDLNLVIEHKRKATEYKKDDDTADAICIARFGNIVDKKILEERRLNYH